MSKKCVYAKKKGSDYRCSITDIDCPDPYKAECDEPEWDYLMKLAEECEGDDTGTVQVGRTNIRYI